MQLWQAAPDRSYSRSTHRTPLWSQTHRRLIPIRPDRKASLNITKRFGRKNMIALHEEELERALAQFHISGRAPLRSSACLEPGGNPARGGKTGPGNCPHQLSICCVIRAESPNDLLIYLVRSQRSKQYQPRGCLICFSESAHCFVHPCSAQLGRLTIPCLEIVAHLRTDSG